MSIQDFLNQTQFQESTFTSYLRMLFNDEQVNRAICLYRIGATLNDGTVFFLIDYLGNVRTGKVVYYLRNGHRDKSDSRHPTWVHSILHSPKPEMCLFGEHLLHVDDRRKPVAIVEAEKTAVICSIVYPQYQWLSVGGIGNLNENRCKALRGKDVLIFPDTDISGETFKLWQEKARRELYPICHSLRVSDLLERTATYDEKAAKIDISDLICSQIEREKEIPFY